MTAEMAGKLKKGDVFFAHRVENTDGALPRAGKPDDGASRAAELALERPHLLGWKPVMLLEEPFENVHESFRSFWSRFDNDSDAGEADARRGSIDRNLPIHDFMGSQA